MKTFKQLIAEVAEPKSDDELNFKQKHAIEVIDHPVSMETQHSSEKVAKSRRADYKKDEDDAVYEGKKLDPVGKADADIDNDGDTDSSDEYLHARRKAIAKAMKEAAEKKLDPVGKADADIDNDGDTDKSDEYLHARRKAIAKAMKKEATQSPYAIGMASAMKQTGDKPPLKKSTITKAHKIAKSIEKNESLQEANEKKIIAGLNAGDSIDVIVQNNLNKKGDNKDEILKVIRDYNWKKRMKKEEVILDEAVAGPQDCWPGYRKVGTKMGTGKNAGKRVNDCQKISEETDLTENLGKASKKMKFWHNTDPRDVKNRLKNSDPAFVDKLAKQPEGKLSGPAELQRRLAVKMKNEALDAHIVRGDGYAGVPDGIVMQAKDRVKKMKPETASDHSKAMYKALADLGWEKTVEGKWVKESFELTEAFKAGAVKLNDGSSVIIKEQDAKLLNQLVDELSGPNREAMMKSAMKNKKGFNEILGFAKEAL